MTWQWVALILGVVWATVAFSWVLAYAARRMESE
jgi:hypothetical protein